MRPLTAKPLIVKLTPNATDVGARSRAAAEAAGADAVSLINTLRGMALHPRTGRAVARRRHRRSVRARRSARSRSRRSRRSPRAVDDSRRRDGRGADAARDARDLLAAGATLVAVGTESFRDPAAGARIAARAGRTCSAKSGFRDRSETGACA